MVIYLTYFLLLAASIGLNILSQKVFKQKWNLWLGYGICALAIGIFIWHFSRPFEILSDFNKAYYLSGRLILENPSLLYQKNTQQFVNIPIIALLFTPISYLNLPGAQFIFTALGVVAILAVILLLFKFTNIRGWQRIAVVVIFAINGPLYYSFKEGNLTHFILLLLLGAILCIANKRDLLLGILLGIVALIKVPLLLFGIYFALIRKWKVLTGFILTILGIFGASILLFGVDSHRVWYRFCIEPFFNKAVSVYNVQSLDSFLIRLLGNPSLTNFKPINEDWHYRLIHYLLLAIVVGVTIWICWRSKRPKTSEEEYLEFSIVMILALVISPISWTHYYLFLLLPLALYIGNKLAVPAGQPWLNLVIVSTLLISPPIIYEEQKNRIIRFVVTKFLISHYLFGAIILLATLLAARWYVAKNSLE